MCLGSSTAIMSLRFFTRLYIFSICKKYIIFFQLYFYAPCACRIKFYIRPTLLVLVYSFRLHFRWCCSFSVLIFAHWLAAAYGLSYINILARLHATCAALYQTDSFSTDFRPSPPAHSGSSLSEETDAGHSSTDSTGQLSPAGQPRGLQGPARSSSGLSGAQQVTCRKMFRGKSPAVSVQ